MSIICRIDELGRDPKVVSRLSDAALQDVTDVEVYWRSRGPSSWLPLNVIAELREMTRRSRTWDRSVMISSVIPSQKYSWSFSGLRSVKGRTTMDFSGTAGDGARGSAGTLDGSRRWRTVGGRPLESLRMTQAIPRQTATAATRRLLPENAEDLQENCEIDRQSSQKDQGDEKDLDLDIPRPLFRRPGTSARRESRGGRR